MSFLMLMCAAPTIINISRLPWNDFDQRNLNAAIHRCPQLYDDAPCVSRFIKVREDIYRVLCGNNFKKDTELQIINQKDIK